MAQPAQAVEITAPLVFDGATDTVGEGVTHVYGATDFIREIEARRTRDALDDARTMAVVIGALRGSAAKWFHESLPCGELPARYVAATTTWDGFLTCFKRLYKPTLSVAELGLQECSKQKPGETAILYCYRVIAKTLPMQKERIAHWTDHAGAKEPLTAAQSAALQDHGGDADKVRQGLEDQHKQSILACATWEARTWGIRLAMEVVCLGFIDANLRRQAVQISLKHKDDWNMFVEKVQAASLGMPKVQSHGPRGGRGHGINSIDQEDDRQTYGYTEDHPGDHDEAHAVIKNRWGLPTTPGATCTFCQRKGHTEAQCNDKKQGRKPGGWAANRPAKKNNKNPKKKVNEVAPNPPTGPASGSPASSAAFHSTNQVTASGNAPGEW